MDNNKENENAGFNGTIYHEGFKFHRKYIGKKIATYWCCQNLEKNSKYQVKIKIDKKGKVIKTIGEHHVSCYHKQSDTRKALGFLQPTDPQDNDFECAPDLTEMMLQRAEEIALNDISLPPKKVHMLVLQEVQLKHKVFKGASNQKIMNRVRNSRSNLNGNDVFRTIENDTISRVKNSNLFFLHFNCSFPNEYDGKLERIIGFGNPALFRVLRGCKRLFIDGTFKFVPKPFYQCLILMVFDEQTDCYVPVFYVLLTSKTEQIYSQALH